MGSRSAQRPEKRVLGEVLNPGLNGCPAMAHDGFSGNCCWDHLLEIKFKIRSSSAGWQRHPAAATLLSWTPWAV
ncbi:MAG: hypothetical protein EXQ58_08950 [Acidobacteria bacterium]|nr:hypothetical protein [Acidobacteriota bacterium]